MVNISSTQIVFAFLGAIIGASVDGFMTIAIGIVFGLVIGGLIR